MAKRDTGLKSTINLGAKVPVKPTIVDIEKTEEAARKIHTVPPKDKSKWHRITTDLPEDEFIQFKTKLVKDGKLRKGQDVVRELIKAYVEA